MEGGIWKGWPLLGVPKKPVFELRHFLLGEGILKAPTGLMDLGQDILGMFISKKLNC